MKLKAVVCRITEIDSNGNESIEQLVNLDPESFIALLDDATKDEASPTDDLAALEAEMGRAKVTAQAPEMPVPVPVPVPNEKLAPGVLIAGDGQTILLPRAAVEPLVQAKTRGELIDKLNELLSPFGIQIAGA